MEVLIDGSSIKSEYDFHCALAEALGVAAFYGRTLDALWDLLSVGVERPLMLRWANSYASRGHMGERLDKIVAVLERVKQQDEQFGLCDRFTYSLD